MDARELQRYKQLLLTKLDELSATRAEALAPVMGARGPRGDLIDQAAVQTEVELQIHLYQTDSRLSRAIEDALARINWGTFGVCESCKQASDLESAWKRCRGHATAATVRSKNTPEH